MNSMQSLYKATPIVRMMIFICFRGTILKKIKYDQISLVAPLVEAT